MEKAFEFVAKETDMFDSDSLPVYVNTLVRKVKDMLEAEKIREKKIEETEAAPPSVKKEEIMEEPNSPSLSAPLARNTFNSDLDLSNPLVFLEKALEFVVKETDMFNRESLPKDVNAVVRKVKDKLAVEKIREEVVEKIIKEAEAAPPLVIKEEIMEDMEEKGKEKKDPQEKEDKPLDIQDLLEAGDISQYDFKIACFCNECRPKIELLSDFGKRIKIKRTVNESHFSEMEEIRETCSTDIHNAAHDTKWMLYVIHKKLNQLNEKSGVPVTPEESSSTIDECDKIFKMLEDDDFNPKGETYSFPKICEYIDECNLSDVIDSAKHFYGRTKANFSAIPILNKMERLEKEKKILVDHTGLLKGQAELARTLPIPDLQREIQAAIDKICPLEINTHNLLGVSDYIDKTLKGMIRKSLTFWKHYRKCPSHGHGANGLDKTLDELLKKVKLFEEEWESNYASFLEKPFYRPDPKKQRIV